MGVFSVTTNTRYNAEGNPLVSVQKSLISQLSTTLASKSISTDVRGNSSVNWSEYTAPAKVTGFSSVPGSNIIAEVVTVDGLTISQTDSVGITSGLVTQDITTVVDGTEQTTSLYRRYTATGMEIKQRDGRGNVSTTVTDIAKRTISVTDAAGNITFTAYDTVHDQPSVVTDAMGNTSCYRYDARGRKVAEWGTAIQPACFGYDEMDNMVTLSTFRAGDETITTDPTERTDRDTTTWTYHPLTGAELSKTYADNTSVTKNYDDYNRIATETDARGNVKTHSYEHARGLHLSTSYSDGTTPRQFSYNHLGQPTQVTDDSGTRTFGYNAYGERISDSLSVDGDTHLIAETQDAMGRSTGFSYSKNGSLQHTVTTGYGTDGRINCAGFVHGGAEKLFGYEYLSGSNLLHRLTKPNGMTLTQSYESHRNLLTGMAYHRGTTLVAQREYVYDSLGRPTARNTARKGTVVNDSFTHNTRSELTAATVSGSNYAYNYDNIGNRITATEGNESTTYIANALNQYTAMGDFTPLFDADGNQTRIKTETGIWEVIYNAENRPVSFTNTESNTVVECAYDSMGRRAYKKVTINDTVTLHQRYIYRGYLQIACVDLARSAHPALWFIFWDPTQPIATRPLSIRINGTWYTYGWDLTKNICELYSTGGGIATSYTYTPFGKVTGSGNVTQPIQRSSEYLDEEFSLSYYNYRHYNLVDGRWLSRDILGEKEGLLLYTFCKNNVIQITDHIGLKINYEKRPCMQVLSKNYLGIEYESEDVYKKCGGYVYKNQKQEPEKFKNSCALRVSRALNHSSNKIVRIKGIDRTRFISDSNKNLNLLGANDLMYYIEQRFGKADLKIYNGNWVDKVKDRCAIVFYVDKRKYATHVGLLKDGEPYSDKNGRTDRNAHIWFVPCVCVYDDKCEYCKQKFEEEKRKQKQMEELLKSLLELQSRV